MVRDIIGKAHAHFGHLILPAQEVLSIGLERVEYGRTNQQIAKRRTERRMRSSRFVAAGWTNLNVETISVRVRTFCFFIVASSTHGLGQHQTSGESARANEYFSLITKLTCCYEFLLFYSLRRCNVHERNLKIVDHYWRWVRRRRCCCYYCCLSTIERFDVDAHIFVLELNELNLRIDDVER